MREIPLVLPEWPAPENVRAVATTRQGGVSGGPFASLNLGSNTDDLPKAVETNRRLLKARLGLVREPAWLRQVHGADVVRADEVTKPLAADAAWTDLLGVPCAVLVADCLPVLFCDKAGTRVAAAHCGWRGLAGGVIGSTLKAMGADAGDVMAWLGPAIGQAAFEVGPEVREVFVGRWPETAGAFRAGKGDRWHADLHELARVQLALAGVGAVFGGDFCTHSDAERFYSYRRDGRTGRQAALIWLASATR